MKSFIFLVLFSAFYSIGQPIPNTEATLYSIPSETDKIEYIRLNDSLVNKPVLLFLQGSLPIPLIFDLGKYRHVNIPFNYKKFTKDYQVVMVSMPQTPVVAKLSDLNEQYCYIPDTTKKNEFSKAYLTADFLSNYVQRTQKVIADLQRNQEWAKGQPIHLIGHSQGAKIATVVAAENSTVSSVSLLGFNAFGRYDELIRRLREKHRSGHVSDEQYEQELAAFYQNWQEIVDHPDIPQHKTWFSFSIDYRTYLKAIKCPIFVGYGTEDPIAHNCDLLPIEFISHGRDNYHVKPYSGMDHNFFELKNGRPDYENGGHWTEVVLDITSWISEFSSN